MLLDPQVYAFYEKSIESRGFVPPALDFREMRKAADAAFNDKTEIIPIYKWEEIEVEGLRMRVYTPHRGLTSGLTGQIGKHVIHIGLVETLFQFVWCTQCTDLAVHHD